MTMYRFADEVAEIAADLIDTVERHDQLDGIRIEYVFLDKAPSAHGRTVLGRARKFGGLGAFLNARVHSEMFAKPVPFFVVEISEDTWRGLNAAQRRALVDHELCHLAVDSDDETLYTRGHDLEEFVGIVQRHGFWKSDVADFSVAVAEQLTFDMGALTRHIDGIGDVDANGEVHRDDDTTVTISHGDASVTLTAAELTTAATTARRPRSARKTVK